MDVTKAKISSDKHWIIKSEFKYDNRNMLVIACPLCGLEYEIRKTNYRKERTCRRCRFVAQNRVTLGRHHGVGDLTKTFYNYFRLTAKKRNIPWDVSIEYLWQLAESQQKKCALSGLDIVFPTITGAGGGFEMDIKTLTKMRLGSGMVEAASLDRIDSDKGYIEGNVQWVCKWINIMKNGLDNDEFVHLCHLVALRHADPEPSRLNWFPYGRDVRRKVQRLEGEEPSQ